VGAVVLGFVAVIVFVIALGWLAIVSRPKWRSRGGPEADWRRPDRRPRSRPRTQTGRPNVNGRCTINCRSGSYKGESSDPTGLSRLCLRGLSSGCSGRSRLPFGRCL